MLGKLRRRRFGEILVGDGLITQQQLDEALEIQRGCGDTIGAILLDIGYITETDIVKALSIQYQLPCLRPSNYEINKKMLDPFDKLFLHRHLLLPFDKIGNLMLVLLHDIPSKEILQEAQAKGGCDLAIYLGTSTDIKQALVTLAPISAKEEESIRSVRVRSRASDDDGRAGMGIAELEVSSEKLLSSLDAAWESIFTTGEDDDADDND